MKKLLALASLALVLLVSSSFAQEATKKKLPAEPVEAQKKKITVEDTKPVTKPVEKTQKAPKTAFVPTVAGTVVSLSKLATDGAGIVTKAEAEAMVKAGEPLALKSGENLYLIYNAKNFFDGKSLAKFAEAKNLGVEGELKQVGGMNVVIAKKIQVVE